MENELKVDYSWLENMNSKELHKTLQLLLDFRKNPISLDNCIDKAVDLLNDRDTKDTQEPTNRINSTVNEDVEENKPVDGLWHNQGDINFLDGGFLIRQRDNGSYDVVICNQLEYNKETGEYTYQYIDGGFYPDLTDEDFVKMIANYADEEPSRYLDNIYLYIWDLVSYMGMAELDPYANYYNGITMEEVRDLLKDREIKITEFDKSNDVIKVETN